MRIPRSVSLFALCGLMGACAWAMSSPADAAPETDGDAASLMPNKIVGRLNRGSFDDLAALYTEDAALVDGPRKVNGRAFVREYWRSVARSANRIERTIDSSFTFGNDTIVFEWTQCNVLASTSYVIRGADVLTLKSGAVARHESYSDDFLNAERRASTTTSSDCPKQQRTQNATGTAANDDAGVQKLARVWPHGDPTLTAAAGAPAIRIEDFAFNDAPDAGETKPEAFYREQLKGISVDTRARWVTKEAPTQMVVQYTMRFGSGLEGKAENGLPTVKPWGEIQALDIITFDGDRATTRRTYWNRGEGQRPRAAAAVTSATSATPSPPASTPPKTSASPPPKPAPKPAPATKPKSTGGTP